MSISMEDIPLPPGRRWFVLSPADDVVASSSRLSEAKRQAVESIDGGALPWESLEALGYRIGRARVVTDGK